MQCKTWFKKSFLRTIALIFILMIVADFSTFAIYVAGADLGGGCRGCALPPEMTCGFLMQLVFCKKKKLCGLLVLK